MILILLPELDELQRLENPLKMWGKIRAHFHFGGTGTSHSSESHRGPQLKTLITFWSKYFILAHTIMRPMKPGFFLYISPHDFFSPF